MERAALRGILNGRRKPSVPSEKERIGGTKVEEKRDAACKIVPSPPSVIIASTVRWSSPWTSTINRCLTRGHSWGRTISGRSVSKGYIIFDFTCHARLHNDIHRILFVNMPGY